MKRKLQSNRGASILMALLLLLLAIVVSAVILLAATNAARHVDNEFDAQQNYLAVCSAAELVRDSILSATYERVDTVITNAEGKSTSSSNVKEPSGIMADWLMRGINGTTDGGTISINVSSQGTENVMPPVQAAFSMDDKFNITIVFSLEQSSTQTSTVADNCYMTLTLTGSKTSDTNTSTNDQTQVTIQKITQTITWSGAKIRKGAVA